MSNPYKVLAEDLFTLLEALSLELPNAPSFYEDEEGYVDFDQYHEDITSRLLNLVQMFGTRMQQLDPNMRKKSLMMNTILAARKAHLDPLAEMSDLAAFMRGIEAKLSEHTPVLLVSVK